MSCWVSCRKHVRPFRICDNYLQLPWKANNKGAISPRTNQKLISREANEMQIQLWFIAIILHLQTSSDQKQLPPNENCPLLPLFMEWEQSALRGQQQPFRFLLRPGTKRLVIQIKIQMQANECWISIRPHRSLQLRRHCAISLISSADDCLSAAVRGV